MQIVISIQKGILFLRLPTYIPAKEKSPNLQQSNGWDGRTFDPLR
jgi:hypothetical protein